MPDKDGDDEKTTKGVVKKKTKQMLNQEYIPEEEYDRYRDNILMRGGDHRSKETRERSYTPTGKQPKGDTPMQKEFKKKYGKKATALDAVKQKYKGQIMDVGKKSKKKANEELDLTKIAEAFGGYLIEISDEKLKQAQDKASKQGKKDQAQRIQRSREERFDKELRGVGKVPTRSAFADQPKSKALRQVVKQARRSRPDLFGDPSAETTNRGIVRTPSASARMMSRKIPVTDKPTPAPDLDFDQATKNLAALSGRISGDISADELDRQILAGRKQQRRKVQSIKQIINPDNRFFTDKPDSETLRTPKTDDEGQFLDKEGKPAPKKRGKRAERDPEIAKMTKAGKKANIEKIKAEIDAKNPIIQTSTGPLPYRNRRVPKTSSITPAGTSAVTTTQTQAEPQAEPSYFQKIKQLRGTTTKGSLPPGVDTVNPEIMGGDAKKFAQMQRTPKQGEVIDTTAFEVQPDQLTGSKPRQRALLEPPKGVDPYDLLNFTDFRKKTKTTTAELDKDKKFKAPDIPKQTAYVPPDQEGENQIKKTNRKPEPEPEPDDTGGKIPPGRAVVTSSGGGRSGGGNSIVSLIRKAKRNPALTFLTFDQLRKYLPSASPFSIRGGRVGTRSAPS